MSDDLTDISGIGAKTAETLACRYTTNRKQ
jgi:predicted flap endonuclease-1-like 5' DNA nuclease